MLCLILVSTNAEAAYRRAITVTRPSGIAGTNIQVPVLLDPAQLTGVSPSGADLRFRDASGTSTLAHYIESWGTSASVVWVRVPSIPVFSSVTIYLHYGDLAGGWPSNFSATFPNALVLSAGTTILGGSQIYDWFDVRPGATLQVAAGAPLSVTARRAIVNGTIAARGRGSPANAASYTDGQGPGAGQATFFGNGGGAGHGGSGGRGYNTFEVPLPPYGSTSGDAIDMGSSGANAYIASPAGAGGGAVTISAQRLAVGGAIDARGADAGPAPGTFGSGGGSGGGVLLRAYDLEVSAIVRADGGAGAMDGGGGGGGGGRIKLLYEHGMTGAPTLSATGGPGDTQFPAENGNSGTVHVGGGLAFDEVNASVGPEENLSAGVGPERAARVRVGNALPNPARAGTRFAIELDHPGSCDLEMVDLQGRRVRSLLSARAFSAGRQDVAWDLTDDRGAHVAPGIYLAKIRVDSHVWKRSVVVTR